MIDGLKTKSKPRPSKQSKEKDMSEVSGDRAKAIVDEARRKKAETDAEHTATGAAEAVLGDD